VQWLDDQTELAENRRILAALLRSDVQARGDYNPKLFHQKPPARRCSRAWVRSATRPLDLLLEAADQGSLQAGMAAR